MKSRLFVKGVKQVLTVRVTLEELPTFEFQLWRVAAKLVRSRVGTACWNEQTCMLQLLEFWMSRLIVIRELLNGALLTKLTLNIRLELVGALLMVRYCEPKLLERVQAVLVEPKLQVGLDWKRLLKVLCRDELIVMIEFDGRASLLSEKQPIEVSPTYNELSDIPQLIVFAIIVTIPEFVKAVPPADAVIGKLVAKFGFVTVAVTMQQVFAANALEKMMVVALVEIAQVQVDVVLLTRQGLLRVKSVVKLRMSVLDAIVELVSILMAICQLALTWLLDGVMSMMRCELTSDAVSKTINISILLQSISINNQQNLLQQLDYQRWLLNNTVFI